MAGINRQALTGVCLANEVREMGRPSKKQLAGIAGGKAAAKTRNRAIYSEMAKKRWEMEREKRRKDESQVGDSQGCVGLP